MDLYGNMIGERYPGLSLSDMAANRKVYGRFTILVNISAMHFHYRFHDVAINISSKWKVHWIR